jgi:hypothetical protein
VGSNLTEGGRFFPRKEPPPGHGCVCMSFRADGRVVEGRATLFRHHREVSRVRPRPDGPPMDVCLFLYMISLAIAAFTATLCISPVDILTVMTETQQK